MWNYMLGFGSKFCVYKWRRLKTSNQINKRSKTNIWHTRQRTRYWVQLLMECHHAGTGHWIATQIQIHCTTLHLYYTLQSTRFGLTWLDLTWLDRIECSSWWNATMDTGQDKSGWTSESCPFNPPYNCNSKYKLGYSKCLSLKQGRYSDYKYMLF